MSKNPYVVAARVNLAPKKPYFALKTGENFTQNVRLKSLIFIVENYRTKLLFNKIILCRKLEEKPSDELLSDSL